ncbi:SPOR domain-containing protein [Chitinophagaceae bacterium MMS25-I14]
MNKGKCTGLLLALCVAGFSAGAQMKVSYTQSQQTGVPDTGGIVVHADPRLAMVTKNHVIQPKAYIRSSRGFRVQIYNGNDRNSATQIKLDFMRRFPGVRTYMTYVQPQFLVKVGNYHTRAEAQKMYKQVSQLYNPCMIVPDIVEINTLNTQQDD